MKFDRAVTAGIGAAMLVVASIPIAYAQSYPGRAAAEIEALETAHNLALVKGDVAALESMMSDDFTFITTRGELRTKAEVVRIFSDPRFNFVYRQISDIRVRVYGDTAVVTGRSTQSTQDRGGKDSSEAYRYTRVYVRRNGRWLAVALQTTREE